MDISQIQQQFFNHIRSKLPSYISFAEEIAQLLNISNDSAYRRIRGEKPITLDETYLLCSKYQVSIDQLLQVNSNTVIFSYDKVDHLSFGFNKFLGFVIKSLELFKSLENPMIYYNSKDLPIFDFMPFPELRAFKFFFWKRTLLGYPELLRQQFKGDEADAESVESAKKIDELWARIPSTDILNEESINVTISQIEFYRQSNIFAGRDILLKVYSQLEELVNHMELKAESGKKTMLNRPPGSVQYEVYFNETLIGDNTVFAKSDMRQITFINHNGLNVMSTEDKDFCDFTYKNLQNIIRKSTHISVVGEKERSIFFNSLRNKIQERKMSI
ncbi:MAG TPA: hypothetical protein VFE53_12505 [Mucilaginibacter sp.]|jgi:hypothetical protein|nr:hypothetical protein [Mucilaginibacter sp.]